MHMYIYIHMHICTWTSILQPPPHGYGRILLISTSTSIYYYVHTTATSTSSSTSTTFTNIIVLPWPYHERGPGKCNAHPYICIYIYIYIYVSLIFSRQSTSICNVSRSAHPKLQAMSQLMGQTERSISQRIEGAATRLECHLHLTNKASIQINWWRQDHAFNLWGLIAFYALNISSQTFTEIICSVLQNWPPFPSCSFSQELKDIDQSFEICEDGQSLSDDVWLNQVDALMRLLRFRKQSKQNMPFSCDAGWIRHLFVKYFDSGAKDFTFWEEVLTRLRAGSIATCFVWWPGLAWVERDHFGRRADEVDWVASFELFKPESRKWPIQACIANGYISLCRAQ